VRGHFSLRTQRSYATAATSTPTAAVADVPADACDPNRLAILSHVCSRLFQIRVTLLVYDAA
jgi:hypothetical protein